MKVKDKPMKVSHWTLKLVESDCGGNGDFIFYL